MTYNLRNHPTSLDAVTRTGLRAKFLRYNDSNWPAPYCFEIDGRENWYSIGGFFNNHQLPQHDLDLIGPWTGTKLKYPEHFLHDIENMSARGRAAREKELIGWCKRRADGYANPKWDTRHMYELSRLLELRIEATAQVED